MNRKSRHDLEIDGLDFHHYVPLRQEKTPYFKAARERLDINPARAYACGDEHKDFSAAMVSGMHPFIVSHGCEDFARLTQKFANPANLQRARKSCAGPVAVSFAKGIKAKTPRTLGR